MHLLHCYRLKALEVEDKAEVYFQNSVQASKFITSLPLTSIGYIQHLLWILFWRGSPLKFPELTCTTGSGKKNNALMAQFVHQNCPQFALICLSQYWSSYNWLSLVGTDRFWLAHYGQNWTILVSMAGIDHWLLASKLPYWTQMDLILPKLQCLAPV